MVLLIHKKERGMNEMNEVYVSNGYEPISEGYENLEELLNNVEYLSSYAFIDYVFDNGEAGRLVRGVDYD